MSLIKFNKSRFPWLREGFPTWFDEKGFFVDDFFSQERSFPAMNIKENENNFDIELAVPGFSKDEIEVILENDVLQVAAEKSKEEVEENEEGYTHKEFSFNTFNRRLKLPLNVDQDQEVKATYKDGILKLNLIKKEGVNRDSKKRIEIS